MGRRAQSKRRSPLVPRLWERRCQSRARNACWAMLATSVSRRPARVCTQTTSLEGTGSRVSQVLVLQEGAQVGPVPVDGTRDPPPNGQEGLLGPLAHLLAPLAFPHHP